MRKYPGTVRLVNWFSAAVDHVALRRFTPFWSLPVLLDVGRELAPGTSSSCKHL